MELKPLQVPYEPHFDPSGDYLVQIASLENLDAACLVWAEVRTRFPELFGGAEQSTIAAELDGGKLMHRLRVGAFARRADAADFCAAYKAKDGDCFVTTR